MNWSDYQLAVFDAVKNTDRHIVVQATAGSGKTTVLVEIANRIDPSLNCRFLAFNKIIAEELGERLPAHFPSSTIHSYGFSQLKKVGDKFKVDGYKLNRVCDAAARSLPFRDGDEQEQFATELRDLINMVRLTQTDLNDRFAVEDLCFERGLVYEPGFTAVYNAVLEVLEWVATESRERHKLSAFALQIVDKLKIMGWNSTSAIPDSRWIDFTDMVELPLKWNLIDAEHDFMLVDEAQDLCMLYFNAIRASVKPNGRLVSVGDSKQNIMGFGGAFLDGMRVIKDTMNALELPLSVSYRCPTSHVALANTVFPGTESPEWAKEGIVTDIDEDQLMREVQRIYDSNDSILIICRKNAPTIRFAMKLLQLRIPAKVKGRDFCAGVKAVVKKCAFSGKNVKRGFEFSKFNDYLYNWYQAELQRLINKGAGEVAKQSLEDKYDSIAILYDTSDARDVHEFIDEIDRLFTDNGDKVLLSSVHKAKGTEYPNTAILEYDTMPLVWNNQTDSQYHAELCVKFVAVTRSKGVMYLVEK